jgi:UDP-N-acetylglucosamine 2-epimerase
MDVLTVVGARPQLIKAAVVSRAFKAAGVAEAIVDTGQHYHEMLNQRLVDELRIDNIIANLGVGSASHAKQTAAIMASLDELIEGLACRPRAILVYGDTNSAIAASLVAAKLHIPLIHVEAGLRSFNRRMPEEVNRVVIDHLADILFCSSAHGVRQLATEGVTRRVFEIGDVMLDAFLSFSKEARAAGAADEVLSRIDGRPFAITTIHRPSNTDDARRLEKIVAELDATGLLCVFPVHPRIAEFANNVLKWANILLSGPLGYFEMLHLLSECQAVITDSGGLQKEAYWAKRPCVTLRNETEWVETLEGGWNKLVDPERQKLTHALKQPPSSAWRELYGNGTASAKIASHVLTFLESDF